MAIQIWHHAIGNEAGVQPRHIKGDGGSRKPYTEFIKVKLPIKQTNNVIFNVEVFE